MRPSAKSLLSWPVCFTTGSILTLHGAQDQIAASDFKAAFDRLQFILDGRPRQRCQPSGQRFLEGLLKGRVGEIIDTGDLHLIHDIQPRFGEQAAQGLERRFILQAAQFTDQLAGFGLLVIEEIKGQERAFQPLERGLVLNVVGGEIVLNIGADLGGKRSKVLLGGDQVDRAALDRVGVPGKIVQFADRRLGRGSLRSGSRSCGSLLGRCGRSSRSGRRRGIGIRSLVLVRARGGGRRRCKGGASGRQGAGKGQAEA